MSQNPESTPIGKQHPIAAIVIAVVAVIALGAVWMDMRARQRTPVLPDPFKGGRGLAAVVNDLSPPRYFTIGYFTERPAGPDDKFFTEFVREFYFLMPKLPATREKLRVWFLLTDVRIDDHPGPCIKFDVGFEDQGVTNHLGYGWMDNPKVLAEHAFGHAKEALNHLEEIQADPHTPHQEL